MQKITLLLLFVAPILMAHAQSVPSGRKINFDQGWKFHLGNASDPARDFNYGTANIFSKSGNAANTAIAIDFKDDYWQDVQLPHDWAVGLPFQYVKNEDLDAHGYKTIGGLFPENSVGWYRKTFSLPSSDSGNHFALQLDGVYRDSKVWINGYYVGGNFSGYIGKTYDITDFIRFGQKNVITVRADATQDEGWFYEGAGIYRHAWLQKLPPVHIRPDDGLFVHTAPRGNDALVSVETVIENTALTPAKVTVQVLLTDRENVLRHISAKIPLAVAAGQSQNIRQDILLKKARLWDVDDPYLYHVKVIVALDNGGADTTGLRFGVRTFAFDKDKGFFLNGRPLKIKGVSNHQDHAGVGSALPDYLQYYRIGLLKEMGANAYRTTHNPPTPELLDACDSLGMLVMDETRLLASGNEYKQQFKDLLVRDRNHPSIFLWSIGNEEWATQHTDIGKRIAQSLLSVQQALDPFRTATYAANMGNSFTGVNEVIPIRGFNYNLPAADAYHKDHPAQPVIGTEVASTVSTRSIFARDTVRCYVPDYDSVYPSWASTAEQWWRYADARQWFMGGFAWTGFDYRGEPTPYQWPNINSHFGIMDMCGFPKTVYYYYQSWWSDKDVLHIAPHWNWRGEEGKPKLVWVNSNADSVALFLNGKNLGKKEMPRNGHLTWTVLYEPGILEAVAYRKGRRLTAKVETTGAPEKIVLIPSKNVLAADGQDAVVVNVHVEDAQGREVPDAANLIHFAMKGDANIIGVGNGDPSSHELDQCLDGSWQRRLFGGRAQVIIRGGIQHGQVELEAFAAGLKNANIILHRE